MLFSKSSDRNILIVMIRSTKVFKNPNLLTCYFSHKDFCFLLLCANVYLFLDFFLFGFFAAQLQSIMKMVHDQSELHLLFYLLFFLGCFNVDVAKMNLLFIGLISINDNPNILNVSALITYCTLILSKVHPKRSNMTST